MFLNQYQARASGLTSLAVWQEESMRFMKEPATAIITSKSSPPPRRHLECCQKAYFSQTYFWQTVASGRFSLQQFWPWTLTLNFDLDLSEVNSEMWCRCWTSKPNFMKLDFYLLINHFHCHVNKRMNKLRNQQTWLYHNTSWRRS